jgi:hypothetical protein
MPKTSPGKLAAVAVNYAVSVGKIAKPDVCEKCGRIGKVHGHHHNGYDDKLDIIWLCPRCHREAHGKNLRADEDELRRHLIPGLSRKEIAERLGVSWRTVEGWEQGRRPVPKRVILHLEALNRPQEQEN